MQLRRLRDTPFLAGDGAGYMRAVPVAVLPVSAKRVIRDSRPPTEVWVGSLNPRVEDVGVDVCGGGRIGVGVRQRQCQLIDTV